MLVQRSDAFGFSNASTGGHMSRSMMLVEMKSLFHALPATAAAEEFDKLIVDENILDKPTLSTRKKSLRHLRQLYGLNPSKTLFRVLWQLGHSDFDSLPQLCLVCAYARDPQLRQSYELIRTLRHGEVLEHAAMEQHLEHSYPSRFSTAMKKSMSRNVNATWTFAGHLQGYATKTRRLPEAQPVSAAYAMFVGYLTGLRGETLLDSAYGSLVAPGRSELLAALVLATAKGLISFKQSADVVEFDFSNFLTPTERSLVYDSQL